MLGIPEGTARSDLHHARARLRQQLGGIRSQL
jgi:RNA polymerase sigma-70 factor (ECF subfamily)